ncbi:hypothetical protein EVAR_52204_1 [Eumeta japonica]|uniref:Uncharacterized protein n=1 Tax=Eumeta variegata TaxID=151549 RepID=A0A4C1Z221_EUMVA|nr:hypothetical protein EVAR_52204_1 [Eumeta japonica]
MATYSARTLRSYENNAKLEEALDNLDWHNIGLSEFQRLTSIKDTASMSRANILHLRFANDIAESMNDIGAMVGDSVVSQEVTKDFEAPNIRRSSFVILNCLNMCMQYDALFSEVMVFDQAYWNWKPLGMFSNGDHELDVTLPTLLENGFIRIRDYPDCQPRRIYFNMNVSELALRPARALLDRRSTRVVYCFSAGKMLEEMLRVDTSAMEHCALPNGCLCIQMSDIHSCGDEKIKYPRTTRHLPPMITGISDFTNNFSEQNIVILPRIPIINTY